MRITEAARRLGTSPRMLRYRESLGLLPPVRPGHRGHRQFTERDMDAVAAALAIERRFDISPAALAFGLRVLAEPAVRAAVVELGERTGRLGRARALDFEKERALRLLGAVGAQPGRAIPRGR
jgi:MerR family transcriptional regulator, copper efflux regulator